MADVEDKQDFSIQVRNFVFHKDGEPWPMGLVGQWKYSLGNNLFDSVAFRGPTILTCTCLVIVALSKSWPWEGQWQKTWELSKKVKPEDAVLL